MSIDKNKIIEAATKYIQKGQFDKAIKEYRKVLTADPKDARIQQKLGELYARNGDSAQAIDCFQKVAEGYTADGFLLKAIAVYKQIIKINPDRIDINFILAQLHQQLGLLGDAMAQYQAIVTHYEAAGNITACLETLHKIVELDPDNTVMRIKLAELYVKQSMIDDAIQELLKVSEYLKKNNRTDDYIKISERIVFLDPKRLELIQELASTYLSMGEAQRALAKLQICFRANPKNVETLSLLARAFQMSGEVPKTASIYKELARIYGAQNQTRLEKETWNKVLQLVPGDHEALRHLNPKAAGPTLPPPKPAPTTPPKPVAMVAVASSNPEPAVTTAAAPQDATSSNLLRLLNETDVYIKYGLLDKARDHLNKLFEQYSDSIDAHEKAAKVHLLRKSHPTALNHLIEVIRLSLAAKDDDRAQLAFEQFKGADPDHPVLPILLDALVTGEPIPSNLKVDAPPPEDAEQDIDVIDIAEIVDDEHSPVADHIDSEHIPLQQATAQTTPIPSISARFDSQPSPVAPMALDDSAYLWAALPEDPDDLDNALASTRPEEISGIRKRFSTYPPSEEVDWASLGEDEGELNAVASDVVAEDASPSPPPISSDSGDAIDWASLDEEDDDALLSGSNEAATPQPQPNVESAPPPSDPVVTPAPLLFSQDSAPEQQDSGTILPEAEAAAQRPIDEIVAEIDATMDSELSELDDVLDEAAFFINQGDLGEAREVLSTALLAYPDSDPVHEMMALLEAHEQYYAAQHRPLDWTDTDMAGAYEEATPMEMALPRLSTDALFEPDLQERVAQSMPQDSSDYQFSFEDAFSEFKKGIEQIVRPEDIETHYDLGLSYREMDLFDDAISEFQQAMNASRGQPKELDCLTMIALCQIATGRLDDAEQTLNDGFISTAITPASESALRFELAALYELQNRSSDALTEFQRVEEYDATYRDVGERIAKLRMASG